MVQIPINKSREARKVVRRLSKNIGMSYFPIYWRPISEILRLLPWSVYKN